MTGDGSHNNQGKKARAKSGGKRSLAGRAAEECDPDWRQWFMEVERKRKALSDPKRRNMIISTINKDGESTTVARRKSEPTPIKKILRKDARLLRAAEESDLFRIRAAWSATVGEDIARETEIFSFKNGIVTVVVSSNALLQEIRQFYQEAITKDLRDIWPASIPLLKIVFTIGKR